MQKYEILNVIPNKRLFFFVSNTTKFFHQQCDNTYFTLFFGEKIAQWYIVCALKNKFSLKLFAHSDKNLFLCTRFWK